MNLWKFHRHALLAACALAMTPSLDWAHEAHPIDRHALVARHDINWPVLAGQIPLGNGNFAFNADGTGLQTLVATRCRTGAGTIFRFRPA